MFVARVQRKVLICCTFLPWCLNFVWLWMKALSTTIQMIINNTTVQACGCNSNVWPFKWTLEERRIKLAEINRSFSVTWSAAFQLLGIKEIFNLWKEFNSHRIFFCTQTWPPTHVKTICYNNRPLTLLFSLKLICELRNVFMSGCRWLKREFSVICTSY